ncbi:hypothetical protein B005_4325 [Nocardiopsis alba ATCC BAA-2165]|uniref:Uncharacterized protein n=1 Tax=Nocardiopsis alba (strain ATCC BAA-2165 / BE74) TaxID=1205910 RepID=J7LEU0_NOCAA|nr:hypothetical protein B005_4325 [Nocardiopsis alba ATCC BAA-2165]
MPRFCPRAGRTPGNIGRPEESRFGAVGMRDAYEFLVASGFDGRLISG